MPCGERRRSTSRNTATVGTPIGTIHCRPRPQIEGWEPQYSGKNDTTKARSHTPTMMSSRSVNPR
ncbi:hypothetical protein [Microbacterium sp. NIBRBAC000506063]|uniref:hypothetical protein n=1 Tax=Microbacterium sp. NIBRBAC000506063 TaxID=2734618 RepID=UPI001BB614F0|nr:hypothetical protein [Microbacterium sp. NIBRBAC000506063]QTV80953.1 hypothetical protein KAE78_14540 [Microbacterium sp. NIBRBAC000506063]